MINSQLPSHLSPHLVSPEDWRLQGSCRDYLDLHFPAADDKSQTQDAIDLCNVCPVLAQCREWSLQRDDEGIAGGMTRRGRQTERHRLGIKLGHHAPCGSESGFRAHKWRDETPCDACRSARNSAETRRRQRAS